jgi:hypothetical protein
MAASHSNASLFISIKNFFAKLFVKVTTTTIAATTTTTSTTSTTAATTTTITTTTTTVMPEDITIPLSQSDRSRRQRQHHSPRVSRHFGRHSAQRWHSKRSHG